MQVHGVRRVRVHRARRTVLRKRVVYILRRCRETKTGIDREDDAYSSGRQGRKDIEASDCGTSGILEVSSAIMCTVISAETISPARAYNDTRDNTSSFDA